MYVVYEIRLDHAQNIVKERKKLKEFVTLEEANNHIERCLKMDTEDGIKNISYTIILEV